MKDLTPERIIETLGLRPHPAEGGHFVETWRADERTEADALPPRYGGPRDHATAIYYLLTPDTFSEMHRLLSDEVFHFYLGDPVEVLRLHPDGSGELVVLGADLAAGQRPQVLVPRGVWQGSRLVEGGRAALMGCTVAPGFEFADYESGRREDLVSGWPDWRERIEALTRQD
jgi:predicted cupin superfamily sugar epimerase